MKLPVSGLELRFREPDGTDELAILEARGEPLERALAALSRLAEVKDAEAGSGVQEYALEGSSFWAGLTVTDVETALLGLRQFIFGDTVVCVFRDRLHECGVRMELSFSIKAFLEEAQPRMARGVRPSDDARWFVIQSGDGGEVRFKLPTAEDQLLAMGSADGASILARRCIEAVDRREVVRAERAMEQMAPAVSRPLAGNCPECGEALTMALHVPTLVMNELASQAAAIHAETDAIAATYHWDEAVILAMPQRRRRAYAEMIRSRERVTA